MVPSDRELMPPPKVLPVRVLAATAFTETKQKLPVTNLLSSKMNNNNSEQRQSAV